MTATVVVPATVRGEEPAPAQPLKRGDACTVVIFGASGDLAKRKLFPALFHLQRDGMLHGRRRSSLAPRLSNWTPPPLAQLRERAPPLGGERR